MWLWLNDEDKVPQIIWLAATFLSPFFRKTTFPTALEASRSPPSQIWLNVTSRLGAEQGFLAELRREQELSGFVCLSVCSCVYPPPQSLSAWDIKTKQHTPENSSLRLQRSGDGIHGYGPIDVLLLSTLSDVTPSDAPVPRGEEEEEGVSLSFFDCQVK